MNNMLNSNQIYEKKHRKTPWSSEVPPLPDIFPQAQDDLKSVKSCPTPFSGDVGLTQLMHLIDEGYFVKARSRCKLFPNEARTWCSVNGCEMLPIHFFFERVKSYSLVDAKEHRDEKEASILEYILNGFVTTTAMICKVDGYHGIDKNSDLEAEETLLNALIHANPDGLKSRDSKGSLPIHTACKRNARLPLIRRVIDEYDEALKIIDAHARLPLHFACEPVVHVPTVLLLAAKYPEATRIGNINGLTPLDLLRMFDKANVAEDLNNMITNPRQGAGPTTSLTPSAPQLLNESYKKCKIESENKGDEEMRNKWANMLLCDFLTARSPTPHCEFCGAPQKLKKRLPPGLTYVQKEHRTCGHIYFDLVTCSEVFMNEAYERGIIE